MKILVVGDPMVDRYYVGNSNRPNPDGPSPLVDVEKIVVCPGGAGNVAENLINLGADVRTLFGIGDVYKNRVLCGDQVVLRFDQGKTLQPITYRGELNGVDAIVVSDYAKGSIDLGTVRWIMDQGLPTFVDCKRWPHVWVPWATCVFPNKAEYEASKTIYDKAPMRLTKLGPDGAELVFSHDDVKMTYRCPTLAEVVRNPTGAGDTAVAAFVYAYMKLGRDKPREALDFAMQASAVAVESTMTKAPTAREIAARFERPACLIYEANDSDIAAPQT